MYSKVCAYRWYDMYIPVCMRMDVCMCTDVHEDDKRSSKTCKYHNPQSHTESRSEASRHNSTITATISIGIVVVIVGIIGLGIVNIVVFTVIAVVFVVAIVTIVLLVTVSIALIGIAIGTPSSPTAYIIITVVSQWS